MATIDQFLASLQTDFGTAGKGKPLEVFCKWFLENDTEWSGSIDKVWLWEEYPNKFALKSIDTCVNWKIHQRILRGQRTR